MLTFPTTSAQLLYGENICLPCNFFRDTKFELQSVFVCNLKQLLTMWNQFHFHMNRNLSHSKIVKTVHMCLSKLTTFIVAYNHHGPCQIIKWSNKIFIFLINNKNISTSIERLEPCFSDNSSETDLAVNVRKCDI